MFQLIILGLLAIEETDGTSKSDGARPLAVPVVTFVTDEGPLSGVLLRGDPKAGRLVLITDEARAVEVPVDSIESPRSLPDRDLRSVSSSALAKALLHEDGLIADQAAEYLGFQGRAVLPLVSRGLHHESAETRARALSIFAVLATDKHSSSIAPLLQDPSVEVRSAALRAYAATGSPDTLRVCERALQFDRSPKVRHEALEQIGRKGDPRGVAPVLEALPRMRERGLRLAAFAALRRLTQMRHGRDAEAWSSWWQCEGEAWMEEQETGR